MAGLYDYNFREQNKIPVHVADKDLYRMSQPVTDYSKMVNPTQNPVKAFHQKTQNEVNASINADQKILDERNGLRQLQEMENIAPGHPFVPRTPTPAQGYGSAEELSLAATHIDRDLENSIAFKKALLDKKAPDVPASALADTKNTTPAESAVKKTKPQSLRPNPAVPRELMLTPSQEKPYLAIQQSVLDNPDDPTQWGQKDIAPRLTDNGTAMPNGWGVVKDSKGRAHIAPPTHWNFFGDTQAEKKWRDQYEKDVKNRELNQTLRDESIKARSSFVGPKRRAQAVDSMLGLQSLEQGAANASSAGLSSALNAIANREAALAKEGRANEEKVFLQLREILKNSYEKTGDKEIDKANAGKAAAIETRMRQNPRILHYINTLDQADLVKATGQLAKQGLMDQRVRDSNSKRMGLNRAVMDWRFRDPSTWIGNKPYAGDNLINMDGLDIEDRGIITGVALYNTHYRDLVRNGDMSPPRALELLNARLIEEGFPPLSALPA